MRASLRLLLPRLARHPASELAEILRGTMLGVTRLPDPESLAGEVNPWV